MTTTRPRLASIPDAGHQLNVGRTFIYKLMDAGVLRRVKIGARAFVVQADIDTYIDGLLAEQAAGGAERRP